MKKKNGFTLIEICVILLIIGIIFIPILFSKVVDDDLEIILTAIKGSEVVVPNYLSVLITVILNWSIIIPLIIFEILILLLK